MPTYIIMIKNRTFVLDNLSSSTDFDRCSSIHSLNLNFILNRINI